MHNRHFIINMVINGEKAPAFSATTLTLPPAQADNTSLIIENTRRGYSRTRAEIEKEISDAIQPPSKLQPKAAVAAPITQQWPINAQTQVVTPDQPQTPITVPSEAVPIEPVAAPLPAGESAEAPAPAEGGEKKKRKRRRKRKAGTGEGSAEPSSTEETSKTTPKPAEGEILLPPVVPPAGHKAADNETEIRLR
jgi:hypothetical protein